MKLGFTLRNVGILGRNLYVGTPVHYSTIDTEDIVEYASKAASVSKACMLATFVALYDAFEYYLCNGHSFKLDGIGTFSLSINAATSVPTAADVVSGADAVTSVGINFLPAKEVKSLISQISWVSEVNTATLPEFTEFVARKIMLGSDSVNLLNADPSEAHSLAIGSQLVLGGWNCPNQMTVKVEGLDADGGAASEEFTMKLVNAKDCLSMVSSAKATVAIKTVQKITVNGVEYEYTGETSSISVTAGTNMVFNGASFVKGSYVLTFKGTDTTGLSASLDGAGLIFESNTGKVAKTPAQTLTEGEHTLVVNGETMKFTCTAEAAPSIGSLSANGVTVLNGGTSGMRKGVAYTFVAVGQNLNKIKDADITLPEGSTLSSSVLALDSSRIQFEVTYGGTAGDIKIGEYFTVHITTTSESTGTVTSVGGIANGGEINCSGYDDLTVVGTDLDKLTFGATMASTGATATGNFTFDASTGTLHTTYNGTYNIAFYNADGDSVYTATCVVADMD